MPGASLPPLILVATALQQNLEPTVSLTGPGQAPMALQQLQPLSHSRPAQLRAQHNKELLLHTSTRLKSLPFNSSQALLLRSQPRKQLLAPLGRHWDPIWHHYLPCRASPHR